ncbi:MAG: hypothetical protein M1828_001634 [Chrysothrix sp. TS-e1954]|nr:MAG: hypothetical protein M1828_001634 [Chrysothrix sp. TS-e1954]
MNSSAADKSAHPIAPKRSKKRKSSDVNNGNNVSSAPEPVQSKSDVEKEKQRTMLKAEWGNHIFDEHLALFTSLFDLRRLNTLARKASFEVATQVLNRLMLDRLAVPENSRERHWLPADIKKTPQIFGYKGSYLPEALKAATVEELSKFDLVHGDDGVLRANRSSTHNGPISRQELKAALDAEKAKLKAALPSTTTSDERGAKRIKIKNEDGTRFDLDSGLDSASIEDRYERVDAQIRALAEENAAMEEKTKKLKSRLKELENQKARKDRLQRLNEELEQALTELD